MTNTERSVAYGDWTLENKCKQQAGFSASLSVSLAPSLSFALSLVAQLLPDSDYNTKARNLYHRENFTAVDCGTYNRVLPQL
jgi:hypothetical protein